jgi:hypothetical protein
MSCELPKERLDDIDRREQPAGPKLAQLCDMVKAETGQDPRGGGWTFVAKPHIVQACLDELPPIARTLARKFYVTSDTGKGDADVVFVWSGIPVRVRHNAKGDVMHAIRLAQLPPSRNGDRRIAGELRLAAWAKAGN